MQILCFHFDQRCRLPREAVFANLYAKFVRKVDWGDEFRREAGSLTAKEKAKILE